MFSNYYRRKDDQENFYKASLQFLAYTPPSELSAEEKKQWSIKMGMAVLLGKNIFNISELVSLPQLPKSTQLSLLHLTKCDSFTAGQGDSEQFGRR